MLAFGKDPGDVQLALTCPPGTTLLISVVNFGLFVGMSARKEN